MKTHEEIHTVRYSEGDRYGFLKLRALFDYAQDIAGNHAELLGIGMTGLQKQGRAWMLARIRMRITQYPKICEPFRILTYPMGFDRLFARREFRFFDQHDQLFCSATSCWLLLELEHLKILNAPHELAGIMPDNAERDITFHTLDKIHTPSTMESCTRCQIQESMLDINQHLNNAEYAAFVQNFLGPGKYPSELQLNYQISVPSDATLDIGGTCNGTDFLICGNLDKKTAFLAEGTLKQ